MDATIIYLSSNAKKKSHHKKVYGTCEKVQDKNKWAIPADFLITIYEPNIKTLSETQVAAVLYHELLHAGYVDDLTEPRVIPHDVEDFKSMLDRFGTGWNIPGTKPRDEIFLEGIVEAAKAKMNEEHNAE